MKRKKKLPIRPLKPGTYISIVQDVKVARRRNGPYMSVRFEIERDAPNIQGLSFGLYVLPREKKI